MRPDDRSPKDPAQQRRHERPSWPDPRRVKSPPRTWTNKSMHHPATRIGEVKHGKS